MTWATQRLEAIKRPGAKGPPVVETLGLGLLDDWGPGWVRKSWTPGRADLRSADGALFGGYLAALADQVLAFAAMTVVSDDAHFRTVNLQVRFLRIGREEPLAIEAQVLASTRRLITVESTFRRPDGALIATASAQQIVLPMGEAG